MLVLFRRTGNISPVCFDTMWRRRLARGHNKDDNPSRQWGGGPQRGQQLQGGPRFVFLSLSLSQSNWALNIYIFSPSLASGSGRATWQKSPLKTNQTLSKSFTLISAPWSPKKVISVSSCIFNFKWIFKLIVMCLTVSAVTFGNILYVLLFGWWISLIYFLICPIMFLTSCASPYGMYL